MMNGLNVSRETKDRLELYAELLVKWNSGINLVSKSSLAALWTRHFADSAQLHDLAVHPVSHWADLGSGAGFPGLVLAILGMERGSPEQVSLVESDSRKSAFLRTVIRETQAPAVVHTDRIMTVPPLRADILSARALADLDTLLGYTHRHMSETGTAIFPKGETWKSELSIAQRRWCFDYRVAKNRLHEGSVILSITGGLREKPAAS